MRARAACQKVVEPTHSDKSGIITRRIEISRLEAAAHTRTEQDAKPADGELIGVLFVSNLVATVIYTARRLWTGWAAGTAFSLAMLVSAPLRRRRAARSEVGHLRRLLARGGRLRRRAESIY